MLDDLFLFLPEAFLYFMRPELLQHGGTFRALPKVFLDQFAASFAADFIRVERKQIADHFAMIVHCSSILSLSFNRAR